MMGIPLYGYDWTLPYLPKGEFAESVGCLEEGNDTELMKNIESVTAKKIKP